MPAPSLHNADSEHLLMLEPHRQHLCNMLEPPLQCWNEQASTSKLLLKLGNYVTKVVMVQPPLQTIKITFRMLDVWGWFFQHVGSYWARLARSSLCNGRGWILSTVAKSSVWFRNKFAHCSRSWAISSVLQHNINRPSTASARHVHRW